MSNVVDHGAAAPKRRLLKPAAAVQYLGNIIDEGTLAKRRMRGEGPPFIRLGNRIFYEDSALDAFIEGCRVQPGNAA